MIEPPMSKDIKQPNRSAGPEPDLLAACKLAKKYLEPEFKEPGPTEGDYNGEKVSTKSLASSVTYKGVPLEEVPEMAARIKTLETELKRHDAVARPACPVTPHDLRMAASDCEYAANSWCSKSADVAAYKQHAVKLRALAEWLEKPPGEMR